MSLLLVGQSYQSWDILRGGILMSTNSTEASRSWFCVLNLHCLYVKDSELYSENMTEEQKAKRKKNTKILRKQFGGMTPEEIVDTAIEMWVKNKPQRTCAVNYEIGDNGNEHLHLVLCDPAKARFSAVCKTYPGIHAEITRGNKEQAEDYILKKGRFEEKSHTVIIPARFYGKISANKNGSSGELMVIQELLEQGKTPREIFEISINFRKHEKIVRAAFFAKRASELPTLRNVNVIWHVGKSGSGKSYTFVKLCETYGEDEVYFLSDYTNQCTGSFDLYCAEKILFMDEFKGQMSYAQILLILQGFKSQIHCRYANAVGIWTEVHITSVLCPEDCYKRMVRAEDRANDDMEQFIRRIDSICYHYKENNEYKVFEIPMIDYTNYADLIIKACGNSNGFRNINKDDNVHFKD